MSNFIKEWTQKEIDHLTLGFRRYSLIVFFLKFVLPITAILMAGMLFIYPQLSGKKTAIHMKATQVTNTVANEHPEMINPKFQGLDSKGEEYQIIAKKAVNETETLVRLYDVTGDITLKNGDWVSGIAKHGLYDRDKKTLQVNDDVNVFITDKDLQVTHMVGSEAFIDMENGIAKSEHPIHMISNTYLFWAQAFISHRDTQIIDFTGPVKLIILKK